jgi:hypothetical protein
VAVNLIIGSRYIVTYERPRSHVEHSIRGVYQGEKESPALHGMRHCFKPLDDTCYAIYISDELITDVEEST